MSAMLVQVVAYTGLGTTGGDCRRFVQDIGHSCFSTQRIGISDVRKPLLRVRHSKEIGSRGRLKH